MLNEELNLVRVLYLINSTPINFIDLYIWFKFDDYVCIYAAAITRNQGK